MQVFMHPRSKSTLVFFTSFLNDSCEESVRGRSPLWLVYRVQREWQPWANITQMSNFMTYSLNRKRSKNQSVSGATTMCLTQCNTSPAHRADQVVDCGLWDVGPLLFNGCVKLLDVCKNWNTRSYTPIQSIPNMLNGWHVRWVRWPWKNWDVFSFQELCTDPCNMGPCIIMLQMRWWSCCLISILICHTCEVDDYLIH